MNVLLLVSSNAYTRAGRRLVGLLRQRGVRCVIRPLSESHAARHPESGDEPARELCALVGSSDIERFDLIVLGLAPRHLCVVLESCQAARKTSSMARAVIATYFPGILQERYYEALLNRAAVDILLLNSSRDLRGYRRLAQEFGFSADNAMVVGHLENGLHTKRAPDANEAVFVYQVLVPAIPADRVRLAGFLDEFARRTWPGPVRLVCHERYPRDPLLLTLRARAMSRLGRSSVTITHESLDTALTRAAVCLSIASTVLLSSMSVSLPAVAIADLGVRDNFGNAFYLGSGCMKRLADLKPDALPAPRPEWFADNVADPAQHVDDLCRRVREIHANRVDRSGLLSLRVTRTPLQWREVWQDTAL